MNAWVILPGRLKSFREEVIRYLKLSHARSTWTKIKGHDRQKKHMIKFIKLRGLQLEGTTGTQDAEVPAWYQETIQGST